MVRTVLSGRGDFGRPTEQPASLETPVTGSASSRPTLPRVLLVDPYRAQDDPMDRKEVERYPSLGILQLAGFARAKGIGVAVVDLTFSRSLAAIDTALRSFRPGVIGIHTKTLTAARSLEIAERARNSGAFLLAGGPDAASRPEHYLRGGFDAVVQGEGEEVLVDVVRRLSEGADPSGVPGISVLREGRVVRGPPRPFLKDLDALPFPAWDLIDMEAYLSDWERRTGERRTAVLTSRGCPFHCSWCSKPTFGTTFRQQSPERVLAEIRDLRDRYGVNYVRFCDDVFGIDRRWLERLLDGLIRELPGLRFECLARVDLLKPDLLARMREAGLSRVYVGVESGSQRMLDLMNRGTRLTQIESAASVLRREGIRQYWFLMLGYPGETLEDIEATIRLFRRFSPEEYSVSIAVPVPGTAFHERVKDRLLHRRAAPRRGGTTLLYEAAYPEYLYRWEQARFRLDAALRRSRQKLSDRVVDRLERAADRFHQEVATPLLTGQRRGPPR